LVCVSKVDDTISGRAFGRIDYWSCTFFIYKTPEYKKPLNTIGKKKILIPADDKFMQRFDENGICQFSVVEEEEGSDPEVIKRISPLSLKVAYSIVANNEEEPNESYQ
jgi:hypothetical protein